MTGFLSVGIVLLQIGIIVILLEAIRRRNIPAVVNALTAIGATLLPFLAKVSFQFVFSRTVFIPPEVTLWIAVAGLLHAFGMLGPYDTTRWWDSLTHTISAAFIAALIYGGLIVVYRTGGLPFSSRGIWMLTVFSTLVVGVIWELVELVARRIGESYDVEPLLVHYGWRDTAMDLGFDGIGALLVIALDVRIFVRIADQIPNLVRVLVLGIGIIIVIGTALLTLTIAFRVDLGRGEG